MPKREFFISSASGINQRLDVFLSKKVKDLTRSQIKKIIKEGKAKVDGIEKKANYRLKTNEMVEIEYEVLKEEEIQPEDIPLDILYSDDDMIVINKPSGMVVHPGAGNKKHTLVNALLFHFPDIKGIGHKERPGIVHRLDKETSGLVVAARNINSYRSLQRQFKQRKVIKVYTGLIWGRMPKKEDEISWPIGRHIKHGERISVKTKKPKQAVTYYTVQKEFREMTLLDIRPVTGRTHQIRVHLSASGHPLVGDTRYGRRRLKKGIPRLFLHASSISLLHPVSGKRVEFSCPIPEDLKDYLDSLEDKAS